MGPRWTWDVALLSTFGYAALLPWHYPVHELMQHHDPTAHLRGVWVAFAITSIAIAFFVRRGLRCGFRDYEISLCAAAWLVPLLSRALAGATGIPLGLIVLLTFYGLVLRRARHDRTIASHSPQLAKA